MITFAFIINVIVRAAYISMAFVLLVKPEVFMFPWMLNKPIIKVVYRISAIISLLALILFDSYIFIGLARLNQSQL